MENLKIYNWQQEYDFFGEEDGMEMESYGGFLELFRKADSHDKIISYKIYKELRDQGFCGEEYREKFGRSRLCMRDRNCRSHGKRLN